MAIGDELTLRHQSSFQANLLLSLLRPRVFVLGGLNFLGRNLILALRKAGYDVQSIAETPRERSALESFGCSAVEIGDPRSLESVRSAAKGCQYAVHCASKFTHFDTSRNQEVLKWNVLITQNVIQACLDLRILKLVVQSSDAVLFDGASLCDVDESHPYPRHPIGLCARSMGAVERIAIAANNAEFKTIVVRPRLLWGCNDEHFLHSLLRRARRGNLRLVNGGEFLTSTCHVKNACEGIILALRSREGGKVFFLTDGKPVLFLQFIRHLLVAGDVVNVDRLLKRSLPLWFVLVVAWVAEALAFIFGSRPFLTRAGVALVGQKMTVYDGEARRQLGYVGHFSREDGYSEIARNRCR